MVVKNPNEDLLENMNATLFGAFTHGSTVLYCLVAQAGAFRFWLELCLLTAYRAPLDALLNMQLPLRSYICTSSHISIHTEIGAMPYRRSARGVPATARIVIFRKASINRRNIDLLCLSHGVPSVYDLRTPTTSFLA
jgi:hypothetical protein